MAKLPRLSGPVDAFWSKTTWEETNFCLAANEHGWTAHDDGEPIPDREDGSDLCARCQAAERALEEGLCRCGAPAVNVGRDLCDAHLEELREQRRREAADRLATMRGLHRYYLPAGDLGVDHDGSGAWRSYHVHEAVGAETLKEFFDALTIAEVGQDGEDFDSYGYAEAPRGVQLAVCRAAGVDPKDAEAFG